MAAMTLGVTGSPLNERREDREKDSPAAAPALSQGLGGDTDAIIGNQPCIESSPGKETEGGGGLDDGVGLWDWGWESGGGSMMGGGGEEGKSRRLASRKSHVAGSGEAEDVGVCRRRGRSPFSTLVSPVALGDGN
jgi:hypothetical protein